MSQHDILRALCVATILSLAGTMPPAAAQTLWPIYVMNADGSAVKKVSRAEERLLGGPCWSHDGKTLYYCGAPRQDQWNRSRIFKQRLDADTVENLGQGAVPHLSPDDQQITFHVRPGNPGGETPGVYVMNADGSGREWLCAGHHPRWSPDGARIALTSDHEGASGIYLFDTITLEKTRVLSGGYDNVIAASWSNDGEQLVFTGQRAGKGEVAVIRAAADQTPSAVFQGNVGWLAEWSPVDQRLLFWIRSDNQERLHTLDLAGDKLPMLIPNQSSNRNSDAVFSPDGKQIAFSSGRGG